MTKERLAEVLGVAEWPCVYDEVLSRFCAQWDDIKKEPIVDFEKLGQLVNDGYIAAEGVSDIKACVALIEADEELHFAVQCLYYALCVYRGPYENELYIDPVPPSLGDYRFTFPMIVLVKCLIHGIEDGRRRGVPEEMLSQHKGAANGDVCEGGHYGTPGMFHWRTVCAFGTMYYTGAFRFEPERVPAGYRMLRRKSDGKLLMLYTAPRDFDEFGQFASAPDQTVFSSCQAVGETDGYLIAPDGRVLDRYVTLSSDEWEIAFDAGDTALSFHIPADVAYTVDTLQDTMKKAVAFFEKYYPDYQVKSVQSYSWLYSPQLVQMLPETSGINRLNRELYLAPVPSGADGFYSFVFKTDDFDIETAATDTSLKRGFVSFVKNGGRVHNGFMYFPAADAARFDANARELYAWDMF